MRIISPFRDYYDSALSYGIDPTLVYVRKTDEYRRELPFEFQKTYNHLANRHHQNDDPFYELITIGFCGKIIQLFKTSRATPKKDIYGQIIREDVFFYGDNALEELYEFLERDDYQQPAIKKKYNRWGWRTDREDFEANKALNLEKIFVDFNVPIFMIDGNRSYNNDAGYKNHTTGLILNPCLKDYRFFTQYNAYQAFQEISMFVGGVLPRPEPDTVEVSEACKVKMKGMDSWSFRKKGPNSKSNAKTSKGKCK